jgi:hypothetical protein
LTLFKTQKLFSPLNHIKTRFQTKNKKHPPKDINKQSHCYLSQGICTVANSKRVNKDQKPAVFSKIQNQPCQIISSFSKE